MENHQRIVQLALCFDAVVFGGYVRDVLICKQDTFHDIDILWYNTIKAPVDTFISVLLAESWVTSSVVTVKQKRSYGENKSITNIVLNDTLTIDLVHYHGSFTSWLSEKDCDFSCNLFYKSKTNNVSIRYIPDCFTYEPDPFSHIYNLTADKKFVSICSRSGDRYWKRMTDRGINLVKKGWVLKGKFIDYPIRNSLGSAYPVVMRGMRLMHSIMNERALGVIEPNINDTCRDRIRRKLFDSDSDSSVDSCESATGDPA